MSSLQTVTPTSQTSPHIRIAVAFYDETHKAKLLQSSQRQRIEELVRIGIVLDPDEFVVHTIFTEQKDYDGWRTYQDLKQFLPDRLSEFRQYFDLEGGTIRSRFDPKSVGTHRIEKAGVAAALVAMNKIFDLTEANWQKIPEIDLKTLDFKYAATASGYVEIEAKATVVENVEMKEPGVSKHKADIAEKKKEQRALDNENELFGAILALPSMTGQEAKCWLLDPPAVAIGMPPAKHRLLARLTFYMEHIRLFSQLRMLIALANRIRTIEALDDYDRLDGLKLVDGKGEPFRFLPGLLHDKTTLWGERVIGRVFPVSKNEFTFYGFDLDVFDLVAGQGFEEISTFKSGLAGSHKISEHGLVDEKDLGRFGIEPGSDWKSAGDRWWRVPLSGRLVVTGSGRATAFMHYSRA